MPKSFHIWPVGVPSDWLVSYCHDPIISWALSYFLVQDVPGPSFTLPAPLTNQGWNARCACCCLGVTALRPSVDRVREYVCKFMCITHTHTLTYLYINRCKYRSYLSIYIYTYFYILKTMSSSWCLHFQSNATGSLPFSPLSVSVTPSPAASLLSPMISATPLMETLFIPLLSLL